MARLPSLAPHMSLATGGAARHRCACHGLLPSAPRHAGCPRQHRCVPDRARRRKWKEERAFGWWGLGTHGRMVRVLAESTRARSLSLSSGHQFQPRPGRREGTQRIAAREKEGAAGGRRGRVRARRRFSVGMCLRSARVCLRGGLLEGRTALLRSRASFSRCWVLYHATP